MSNVQISEELFSRLYAYFLMDRREPFISRAVTAHCTAHKRWTHGEPVEIWRDEYEFLCVRYADGNWWHYRQTETGYEWW